MGLLAMPYVHAKGLTTANLLRVFAAKARCSHTQRRADECWRELEQRLYADELTVLSIAWSHALSDEGPAELDAVVRTLVAKLPCRHCGDLRCRGEGVQFGYCWKHAPC